MAKKKEVQKVQEISLLDQLRQQHAQFVQQKEIAQTNLNQLSGAIFACEIMINKQIENTPK